MSRQKRVWMLIVVGLLVLVGAGRVRAEAPAHFASLRISLWPEYDRPAVLVMYDIVLPAGSTSPVGLSIPIPARAGQPHAVAYQEPSGNLINADFQYSAEGEWGIITVNAIMPNLHIEYYDPALQKDGAQRHFEYEWPGGFVVDALTLVVQQPVGASQMQITPVLGDGHVASDGLTYYEANMGALQSDQTFQVSVSYQKSDDTLSVQALQLNTGVPEDQPAAGEVTWHKVLPWVVTVLGLVLVVVGLVWYWVGSRSAPAPAPRHRHKKRQPMPPEAYAADLRSDEVRYCPQCGARAQPGDKFCRLCGTKLR